MQVLIVESEPGLAEVWASHLRRQGAAVTTALSQDAAVQVLQNDDVDVIVLDLVLEGGSAIAMRADVTSERDLVQMVERCMEEFGRIDILDYNVGISLAGGDGKLPEVTEEAFDRVMAVNLRGNIMACKHVVPIMIEQGGGSIINISSLAAIEKNPMVTYKTSKAAMVAFTEQLAITNAAHGVRANAILPGLMDTPMAIDMRAPLLGQTRAEMVEARNKRVPLRNRMGTAWDVAHAALYLASDESGFVSGISLRVDGAAGVNVG